MFDLHSHVDMHQCSAVSDGAPQGSVFLLVSINVSFSADDWILILSFDCL